MAATLGCFLPCQAVGCSAEPQSGSLRAVVAAKPGCGLDSPPLPRLSASPRRAAFLSGSHLSTSRPLQPEGCGCHAHLHSPSSLYLEPSGCGSSLEVPLQSSTPLLCLFSSPHSLLKTVRPCLAHGQLGLILSIPHGHPEHTRNNSEAQSQE